MICLDYEDERFAPKARALLETRHSFEVLIRGHARDVLKEHIVAGQIPDLGRLTRTPRLQLLVGVLALAQGKGLAACFVEMDDAIALRVGVSLA